MKDREKKAEAAKQKNAVRFHMTDAERKKSDAALYETGGQAGRVAKRLYMEYVDELLAAKQARAGTKK